MILETVVVGSLEVNCYILASDKGKQAIIIDPGADEKTIRRVLDKNRLKPAFVINTHGHYDHIGCDDAFGVPVYVHSADAAMLMDARNNFSALLSTPYSVLAPIRNLADNQTLALDDIALLVRHMPGHTAGGIALVLTKPQNRIVFTGDSLFCQSIGRTDLGVGGNEETLVRAIREKLLVLPDDTVVYPGHGPASRIGEERANNPFLQ